MKSATEEICKLCLERKKLCDSHIIPEYMYKPTYDQIHRAIWLQDNLLAKRRYLQKGHRSKILCKDCEGFVNNNIEKPFLNFWKSAEFPLVVRDSIVVLNVDYDTVKLFVLLNLWRAEYDSTIGRNVNLGIHKEKILSLGVRSYFLTFLIKHIAYN